MRTWERTGHRFSPERVPPLEVNEYGAPLRYEAERVTLFRPGSGLLYLGHDLLLPGKGHRRADGDERLLLTRDDDGEVRAVANLCTHSLRPIARDDEFVDRSCITCPYHQWSFRRDGTLIGGRDFDFGTGEAAEQRKAALALPPYTTMSWRGFHFAVDPEREGEFATEFARIEEDFAARGLSDQLDFDGWTVIATEDTEYRADWKAYMDVFGDCYHVPPYHPGLASFSDCKTLEWTFGDHFHVQFLDIAPERGRSSPGYAAWLRGLDAYYAAKGTETGTFAVAWLGLYPNLMIELYNGLRVISILLPTGPDSHVNRLHYCVPSDMETVAPGLPRTMKDAWDETAVEDDVLVQTRYDGIVAARELGLKLDSYVVNLSGPAPEAGNAHFYDWYRRQLGL